MSNLNGKTTHAIATLVWIVIGIIVIVLITPINRDIERTERRVDEIEQTRLPRIEMHLSEQRSEISDIRARQEGQTETLKSISENVEYIRRRLEE